MNKTLKYAIQQLKKFVLQASNLKDKVQTDFKKM